ncbi:Polysaccharide biosynthesis protein [Anatilimnocola aggregata]|uniref:Polysaccharide biosynthesis protein n=1 Tax=Anatilimnocola aggregata TaxID=2528021 RepID=A0A517YLE2_9BACT|nr:oligosaccharide flippase family protein [Anatilimnocola aggregata]QDU31039.1 Polysaccharide biosynthesis protein [Anatilimnocola aggregata]
MDATSQLPSNDLAALAAVRECADVDEGQAVTNDVAVLPLSHSVLWVVLARAWSVASTAALAFLLPKLFSDSVCGEVLLIINLIGLAAMVASFGLPEAMIRLVAERLAHQRLASIRPLIARCGQLLFCTTLVVATAVSIYFWVHGFDFFHLPRNPLLSLAIATAIVVLSWQLVGVAILRGLHEVRWSNLLSGGQSGGPIAVTAFMLVLALVFLWQSTLLTSTYVAILLLHAILFTGGLTAWRLWKTMPAPGTAGLLASMSAEHVPSFRDLAADALPIALSQIAAFCTLSADLWVAGRFLGTDDVAFYGSAKRLVLLVGIPEQLALLAIIANIPDLYSRGKLAELQHLVRKMTTLAAIPALIACLGLLLVPEQILSIAFKPHYKVAASALMILTLGQLSANLLGPCGYMLLMTGHRWSVLLITSLCGSAAIIAGAYGAAYGGLMGLAIAAASCTAAQVILEWLAAGYFVGVWCHASPWALTAKGMAFATEEKVS